MRNAGTSLALGLVGLRGMSVQRSKTYGWPILLALLLCAAGRANAGVGVFLEEPFGAFGDMNPTGHAAIYLSHVCAASLTELRPCEPGEPGVVLSRYHRISGYDWIAIPLMAYLFAVDEPNQVPLYATPDMVADLRDNYRRSHLLEVAPDGKNGKTPGGEWIQLIGAAYDRKIYSFEIETTEEQDLRFIQKFNSGRNKSHFNLLFHNCADFSRNVIDFYYPHAVHRSFFEDDGITTPKQVAKSLVTYSRKHSDLLFSSFVIPQVPGTVPRSHPIRGVLESFLRSKKYSLPVAALHPLVICGLAVAYLTTAECDPRRHFTNKMEPESQPAAIITSLEANHNMNSAVTSSSGGR